MMTRWLFCGALLAAATPVFPHRLDEYLQATLLSLKPSEIDGSMRLIPGVAVSNAVISEIDSNQDGVFSPGEQQAYAEKVLRELSLRIDDRPLSLSLRSATFPAPAEMREGLGEIHIDFSARLSAGTSQRTVVIEDHYEPQLSVYLMNTLVPKDPGIHITGQNRNHNQSRYEVSYTQAGANQFHWRFIGARGFLGLSLGCCLLAISALKATRPFKTWSSKRTVSVSKYPQSG